MLKKMKCKILMTLILVIVFHFCVNSVCYAEINELYGNSSEETNIDSIPGSVLLEWISDLAYKFGSMTEDIGITLMGWFTGNPTFPYSDKIIFNAMPLLDVNFINPANGSLFKDANGNITAIGNTVRNVYFTGLSIALGFLGLIVAITAIRLAFSTISSEKAKYKQVIANTIITLILLFSLHYLIAFMIYLNETLVEVASTVLLDAFTGDEAEEIIAKLEEDTMKNDKKLVQNFFDKMGPNWLSPLTWVKETLKALARVGEAIVKALAKAVDWLKDKWNSFWGGKDADDADEDITLDPNNPEDLKSIESIYPKRKTMINEVLNNDTATHIAAYLLRNPAYRDVYLKWAEGSDMDSFDNNGVSGVAISITSMLNDTLNIIDTGYLGIKTLHSSTFYILNNTYAQLTEENALKGTSDDLPHKITSTKAYNAYIVDCDNKISVLQKERAALSWNQLVKKHEKDNTIKIYRTLKVYAQAYYKFVYDGDDKEKKETKDIISSMGEYFKSNAKYVDLEAGDWAPTSTSIPFALLYTIFIIQSLMFFISYIKRLFYVIILSVLGPIVVVFDYLVKAI